MRPPQLAILPTHVREGNLIVLSGEGPSEANGYLHIDKIGDDVTVDEGYAHARLTGSNLLSVLHDVLGNLGRINRIVKLLGMVNAVSDIGGHPVIVNGCADLRERAGRSWRARAIYLRWLLAAGGTSPSRSRRWSPFKGKTTADVSAAAYT